MDKLDEWMNRASDPLNPQRIDSSSAPKKQHSPPQAGYSQQPRLAGPNKKSPAAGGTPYSPKPSQQQASFSPGPQQPRLAGPNTKTSRSSGTPYPNFQKGRQPQQPRQVQQSRSPQQQQRPQSQRSQQPQRGSQQPQRGSKQPQRQQSPQPQQPQQRPQQRPSKQSSRNLTMPLVAGKPATILPHKLKIIPLGGLNEVGKNLMAFEYENDIVIVDMGLEFPSEDMFGIDYVIPDTSYLEDNKKRIRGVIITHGHLDHTGGIPYILPKLDFPPVYGTKLTIGLIKKRIDEFKLDKMTKLNVIDPDKPIKLGQFTASFFRVAHSIPDAVGVALETPVGIVVHTGDFKFDDTPARNQEKADIHKMDALGHKNVLALFCESTNALKPGHSISEREVGITLEKVIRESPGRVIIASFSSQVGRIQQIIDAGVANNRKIFVSGRSMRETMDISAKLGYLTFPKDIISDIKKYKKTPDKETLILTTGSQGEAVSALSRIASNEHPHVKIKKGDTIVLSSSPIIGNERAICTVINNLAILGAEVIHNQIMEVHTSGHGKQDELARMIDLINPKYLIPIHGEYFMRRELARLGQQRCGMPEENVIMLQNGDILLAENGKVYKSNETVDTKYILIDGLGEGHIDSQVQFDREIMSQNGALVVLVYITKNRKLKKTPDVVSRGFIYMHESEEITKEISNIAADAYDRITSKNPGANRQDIKKYIRQTIDKYTHSKIERRPLIIPLLIET